MVAMLASNSPFAIQHSLNGDGSELVQKHNQDMPGNQHALTKAMKRPFAGEKIIHHQRRFR
jgi:hypothetical protein